MVLFIPVSEDHGMIEAAEKGALTLEKLEAMTCVCSVGLDMIAVPGDTSTATLSGIIADEAAIGMVNNKTTAVRIIPVIGRGVGESVEFVDCWVMHPLWQSIHIVAKHLLQEVAEYLHLYTVLKTKK